MVGDQQVYRIETFIRMLLTLEQRASTGFPTFQGDERDIMFLYGRHGSSNTILSQTRSALVSLRPEDIFEITPSSYASAPAMLLQPH